jgi:hypothetical protein
MQEFATVQRVDVETGEARIAAVTLDLAVVDPVVAERAEIEVRIRIVASPCAQPAELRNHNDEWSNRNGAPKSKPP